jgi:formylglycine-generating enzyme required for sulfatase activity
VQHIASVREPQKMGEMKMQKKRKESLEKLGLIVLIVVLVFALSAVFGCGHKKRSRLHLKFDKKEKVYFNSIGMKFVLMPKGSFIMGSQLKETGRNKEEKPHRVKISEAFYLQTTEVTQGQWKKIMGEDNPSYFKECGDDCPVEQVSWNDAQTFIAKLNEKEKIKKYRLPTEAEWEYACRAKTKTAFHTGDCISADQANYNGNYPLQDCPEGEYRGGTVAVGGFDPNPRGLYDMHGNVWEWCQDWKDKYPSRPSITDPKGPKHGKLRVLRGGSWNSMGRQVRTAYRSGSAPDSSTSYIGFRVVLSY